MLINSFKNMGLGVEPDNTLFNRLNFIMEILND